VQSAVAISYQGRRNVARNNPAAETWGAFMRSHLAKLKMNQADFGRRMEATGYGISKQTVSQWVNGENAPDANTALAVAQALGAQDAEALRAAGFGLVADRLENRDADTAGSEPIDPVIQEIMGMTNLSLKFRQTMVAEYLAGQEEIRRRYRSVSKMASEESGSAGSAA
jgi:transcriptional regulator with XRE-family HTH domain